jgi:hypothetical protein
VFAAGGYAVGGLTIRAGRPRICRGYRRQAQTGRSRPLVDGWVLAYEASWCGDRRAEGEPPGELGDNPDEYITGIEELTAVDEAVAAAQEYLKRIGYREPA